MVLGPDPTREEGKESGKCREVLERRFGQMSRSGNTDSTHREATGGFVLFCVFVCLLTHQNLKIDDLPIISVSRNLSSHTFPRGKTERWGL